MLPPKLIMAPIDFSEPSEEAFKTATELASRFDSGLCVVHVVPAIPKLHSAGEFFHEAEYEQELHKAAETKLLERVQQAAQRGVNARYIVGTANDVSGELLRIAEHNQADLIVIATHGMTGWRRLAFGSVAEKIVRLANCPVLILRAQQEAESSAAKSQYSKTPAAV